jgi:hypothetical protein
MSGFNADLHTTFIIPNFVLNEPLYILLLYTDCNTLSLCCDPIRNAVYFSDKWTLWVIEKEGQYYYIKSHKPRYNYTQYLGAPNKNGYVFQYTSKNRFTRWSIHKENKVYRIKYVGEKFNTTEISVVVSRYNENVEWTRAYNDIAFIYNKGDMIAEPAEYLDNIGREGHTYLHHITTKYNRLTDRTVFLQGNPFEHNPTVLFGLDNYELTLDVQPLGLFYLQKLNIPPKTLVDALKVRTDYGLEYLTIEINADLQSYLFHDQGAELTCNNFKYINKSAKETVFNYFLRNARYPYDPDNIQSIQFTFCALFSVKKENIQRHGVDQYTKLIYILLTHDPQGGAAGYVLERLWLYIFGYEH